MTLQNFLIINGITPEVLVKYGEIAGKQTGEYPISRPLCAKVLSGKKITYSSQTRVMRAVVLYFRACGLDDKTIQAKVEQIQF